MTLKLENLNPINLKGWNNLVLESNQFSLFHSLEWAKVLNESYKYSPHYLVSIENNQLMVSIPLMEVNSIVTGRRGVSLPFSDYCDPIIDKKLNTRELIEHTIQYAKKLGWKYLEFHGGENLFHGSPSSSIYYGHSLQLSKNIDEIFSTFRDSTQRNIKKAVRLGVEITFNRSLESVKQFYRLQCRTRKRHKLPAQPFYFFKAIYDHIISKESGIVVNAKYKKQIIGTAVFFHFGDKAFFTFGASDLSYQHLRMNNLIMWEAIKHYSTRGFKSLHFGRTNLNDIGLNQFKSGWGTTKFFIKYFKYDIENNAFISNSGRFYDVLHLLYNKMPIPISRLLSFFLYKHFG